MAIMFNTILRESDLPLADVRLLRHKDKRAARGRTPYELWRDNRQQFDPAPIDTKRKQPIKVEGAVLGIVPGHT